MRMPIVKGVATFAVAALLSVAALAQAPTAPPTTTTAAAQPPVQEAAGAQDPSYVIGTDDVLSIVFWELPSHSAEVAVRPDGKITLPLLNDIQAAGLTPDQLRAAITTASAKYIREPAVSVIVKAINSRKVFVTGQVGRPGPYPLTQPTTVLQMLSIAGGPNDFAKKSKISVLRVQQGQTTSLKFNYKDVIDGKKLEQNIELRPGDTLIVP
jgi:polysaccharide export outer membrane protein